MLETGWDEEEVHTGTPMEEGMSESSAKVTDPVCGMSVEPATAAARVEHEGATYYFCSSGCAATFRADPGKYATAPA